MLWRGFAYAAGAAIGHSCIDTSRKWASQRLSTLELVALVGFFDSILLAAMAACTASSPLLSPLVEQPDFLAALVVTALIKLVAGLMYQRALLVSPLSVTVPYLAFTPVLLVFTSYILINELPSSLGLLGVVIVTLGGYLLSLHHHAGRSGELELKKERPPAKVMTSLFPWSFGGSSRSLELGKAEGGVLVTDGAAAAAAAAANSDRGGFISRITARFPQFEWEEGSILMLGVAGLLSVGNSLDKMAAHLAPSVVGFAALQRSLTALPVVLYLAVTSPKSFSHLIKQFPILLAISMFEVVAFICYLKSLELLLVSYSVAAKRSNVLLSVLVGRIVFKERIWRRLPFILMMVIGMTLILFA